MRIPMLVIFLAALGPIAVAVHHDSDLFHASKYPSGDVIIRDVAVIGGGSSGTYSAINLRLLGQSVVVVERETVLGGHVNTYTDPTTGGTVDYGVQAFFNIQVTKNFFGHFNIATSPYTGLPNTSYAFTDFNTGEPITFKGSQDLTPWGEQLDRFPWLNYGYNMSYPVEEDLLLPLKDFLIKYNMSDIAYYLYFAAEGLSSPLRRSTLDVMKMVDPSFLQALMGGDVATTTHNNGQLFVKALAELGSDTLLSSTVTAARREIHGTGVSLVVKTPTGPKLIKASKLLVTIPPLLSNMVFFDLDATEHNLFKQWNYMGYYTVLLNNTGLPPGYVWVNADNETGDYQIPNLPGASQVSDSWVPGLFYAWYRSPYDVSQEKVEADTIATIRNLQEVNNFTKSTPNVIEYRSHTPYKLYVSPEAIADGFYAKLDGLQGHRRTWYTGAAFVSHSSGLIWNFTQEYIFPKILEARN